MPDPAHIPGMIETGEQQQLAALAREPFVADHGLIVEFGCFFGRSTACLVNGAAEWWTPERGGPAILAYDSFACVEGGGFARIVSNFARSGGIQGLLQRSRGRLNFHPVYQHYMSPAEASGLLSTTVAELRDTTFAGGPIALMHIDAPKFYEELKYVLFRFFPSLVPGAAVVFQDYFYHWSAELIAAAQVLVEGGFLRFERSMASSATARVLRAPSAAELLELDMLMSAASVPALLDRSLETVQQMDRDRTVEFVPRIYLAKIQHLWEQGDFMGAKQTFLRLLKACDGRLPKAAFEDFQELMGYGFSLRKVYELDHTP